MRATPIFVTDREDVLVAMMAWGWTTPESCLKSESLASMFSTMASMTRSHEDSEESEVLGVIRDMISSCLALAAASVRVPVLMAFLKVRGMLAFTIPMPLSRAAF